MNTLCPGRFSGPSRQSPGVVAPGCVIQIIEVRWTKASRGAPAAAWRNAVPLSFPMPEASDQGPVLLHQVCCDEAGGFVPRMAPRLKAVSAGQLEAHRLAVSLCGEGVTLALFGTPLTLTTGRPTEQVGLVSGQWLRIVMNRRIAVEYTWAYRRFVYNIACCKPLEFEALLAQTDALCVINRETRLW